MPKTYLVPAIKRGFQILESLSESGSGLTISDIHRALHLPLSSAATILYTLELLGYIERKGDHARYTLSTKLLGLSHRMDQEEMVGRCHDLLVKLVDESGFTAHLAVMRGTNSMYVDRVASPGLIQISSYIGMTWPAYSSGVGKAILAFLPQEERHEILSAIDFKKITPKTVVARTVLEKQLAKFRTLGYAWEINEGEMGVGCVAAPIYGSENGTGRSVVAAVSITGTEAQISRSAIPRIGKIVKKYAQVMSKRLEHFRK